MDISTHTQKVPIKMFANFNRGIYIPLLTEADNAKTIHDRIKGEGARISVDSISRLINGVEEVVKDFEVVTVTNHHVVVEKKTKSSDVQVFSRIPDSKLELPKSPAIHASRGRGRNFDPQTPILASKRDTTYAKIMEMLKTGATMEDLLAATDNKTAGGVNDVLSWQVKHRGYGLRFERDTGKYFLVFPTGIKDIVYKE